MQLVAIDGSLFVLLYRESADPTPELWRSDDGGATWVLVRRMDI